MKNLFYIFLVLLIACSESTVEPDFSRVGTEYFPLKVGQYAIYEVQSIDFDILGTIDTAAFEMKSEVVDSFENLAGDISYIIHRHTRANESAPWEFQAAWSAYRSSNQAVLIEENVPFLKLTFPLENDKKWDGNRLNTQEQDEYTLDSLNIPYITINNDTINNSLTVIQSDNQDLIIQQDKRVEIYGKNIGLLYKQSILLNYCAEPACIGLEEIESGFVFNQSILEYGEN